MSEITECTDRHAGSLAYRAVKGIRCGNNHSGNHDITRSTGGYYECVGCGEFFTHQQIADPADEEIGNRGVIRA